MTTSPTPSLDHLLPEGLRRDVEQASGASVIGINPRGGGGASREGAELVLDYGEGRKVRAYMNYDVNRAGAGDDAAFLREAAVLKALSGPLKTAGVRVARFITALPERRALLGEFIGGESNFNKLKTEEERLAVASDFMAQLAALHAIDISRNPVEGMGPVRKPSETIRLRLAELRNRHEGAGWDPLIHLTLNWLEANIPPDPERTVLVHGDAGPANFLYADGKVTALLDWELTHYGDPMADLAMVCIRMLFQPFVALPKAFAAYEAAGGAKVDIQRIRYYRLFFQVGFSGRSRYEDPAAPPPPNLGMNLVYSTIHRRVLSEALAELAGVDLPRVVLPDAPPGAYDRSFELALIDLRDFIVPRIADQQAAVKAKGLARLVKWWRDIERYKPGFDAAEKAEISTALDQNFATAEEAWIALSDQVKAGTLDFTTALRLCNGRVARDAALLADAMGGLAQTRFPPLE